MAEDRKSEFSFNSEFHVSVMSDKDVRVNGFIPIKHVVFCPTTWLIFSLFVSECMEIFFGNYSALHNVWDKDSVYLDLPLILPPF